MTSPPSSGKKPWIAALLSALIPGAGQLYAGERSRGMRLMIVDGLLLGGFAAAVVFFQAEVVKTWASLPGLTLVMVINLVLLSYRAWAAHDAYHLVAAGDGDRSAQTLLLGVVVWVLVLAPHVFIGFYNIVQYSVIEDVFAAPADPTTTTSQPIAGEPTAPPDDAPSSTTTTVGAPEPAIWDGLERLNVLLLGTDVGEGRDGLRTDTMIVVSIDPEGGDTAMISLPRNMSGITLPEGHGVWDCDCFPRLLNDLFEEAELNPQWFPGEGEPGPRAMKAAIGNLLELEIHYYAMVSLHGFVGIVDALGGVTIDVPNRIVDERYPHEDGVTYEHIVIEKGTQHLDGHLALAYARIRRHADDFARMNRQRCVLRAVMAQTNPFEMVTSYPAIADVMKQSLRTDIPQDRLVDFIDLLPVIDFERVAVLHIDREYISGTADRRTYYDEERIKAETASILDDPTTAHDGLNLENTCD